MNENIIKNPPTDAFVELIEVVAHLRSENGCEWDRQQTFKSMRPHLLEEAREVVEAIDNEDHEHLCEELGDLLLHVLFLTQIAYEQDRFNLKRVIKGITSKLKRRHPHVFGDLEVENTEEILANWERIKQTEKNGESS